MTDYEKIKPKSELNKVFDKIKYLYSEFEKKNPEFINVNCPFCQENKSNLHFRYLNSNYRKCVFCESIYMSPRLSKSWLNEYYDFIHDELFFTIAESQREIRIEKIMIPRWELIMNRLKSNLISRSFNNYIEIGPGVGYFTEVAINNNFSNNYILVEPDEKYHHILYNLNDNLKIVHKMFEDCNDDDLYKADVIFINSVIEHPFSLELFFSKIHKFLNKDGIVVLVDMHANGFDIELLKDQSQNVTAHHILQVGSIKGIETICKNSNLEMFDVFSTGSLDMDIIFEFACKQNSNNPFKGFENLLREMK